MVGVAGMRMTITAVVVTAKSAARARSLRAHRLSSSDWSYPNANRRSAVTDAIEAAAALRNTASDLEVTRPAKLRRRNSYEATC